MPLYEYKCEKCGEVFEVMQKFADAPLTAHATCGGAVHRLLSAPALQFKGSGWYITDYAKSSRSSSGKSDGGEKKSESPAKAESSEKKPASTSSPTSESHA
jgi:putative FmdB family regulatory protein